MQRFFNFLLALIKWPLALGMILIILPALKADMAILYQGLSLTVLEWFFIPLLFTIVLWLLIPGISGSFLAILEHEVTHMIFAILTFHSPQDINIQRGVGGNFIFKGQGNWLLHLALLQLTLGSFLTG